MDEQKKRGRPAGSKAKFPHHGKMRDEFLKHNFDIIAEWVVLYRSSHADVQAQLITDALPYIYPRRKPEDSSGDSKESPLAVFVPTDEQLTMLCELAKKK